MSADGAGASLMRTRTGWHGLSVVSPAQSGLPVLILVSNIQVVSRCPDRVGERSPAGRLKDARLAFEKMLTYAINHVGLFSEEIALTGEQIGNFPQAFTHLALIDAAITLHAAFNTASWRRWVPLMSAVDLRPLAVRQDVHLPLLVPAGHDRTGAAHRGPADALVPHRTAGPSAADE